jgi:hypothetical protein
MGDCCNMYGRRPNSEPEPSERTTATGFSKNFAKNLSCLRAASER